MSFNNESKARVAFYVKTKLSNLVAFLTASFFTLASIVSLYLYHLYVYLGIKPEPLHLIFFLGIIAIFIHWGITGFIGLLEGVRSY